uniref:Uncharacterized protein n=1 Tax=viral metagenome TaxID=1070528 RepID=A0A6C0K0I4_9ZZZZ
MKETYSPPLQYNHRQTNNTKPTPKTNTTNMENYEDDASYFSCMSRLPSSQEASGHKKKVYTIRDVPELTMLFLKAYTRLFEVIPDLETKTSSWSAELAERLHLLIKGAVQSGKTRILTALALFMTMVHKQSVIVLVRNITEDSSQYHDAWTEFMAKFEEFCADHGVLFDMEDFDGLPPSYFAKDLTIRAEEEVDINDEDDDDDDKEMDILDAMLSGPTMIVSLLNVHQLQKVNAVLGTVRREYEDMIGITVLVDEVDQLLYGEDREKVNPGLDRLLSEADHIIGVTATTWKPLHDLDKKFFSTDNVYVMTPPVNYRGIMDLSYVTIKDLPKEKCAGALASDPDLLQFLLQHRNDAPMMVNRRGHDGVLRKDRHPLLALINTERLIAKQSSLMEDIARHPELEKKYTIMTYNGKCIEIYAPLLSKRVDLQLPACSKKLKRQGNRLICRGGSLRHVLQWLKKQPAWWKRFPRILIIAQNMVGRGLNIVSHDYKWHLSDFFWRPSHDAEIANKMQDQRGCGIFTDDLICRVHCTLENERDLKRGHQLQEEVYQRTDGMEDTPIAEALQTMTFHKKKVPQGKISGKKGGKFGGVIVDTPDDGGLSMEEFGLGMIPEEPEDEEAEDKASKKKSEPYTVEQDEKRLREKMFPKWGSEDDVTKIGGFMRRLEHDKVYSVNEIKALCKNEDQMSVTLSHLIQPYIPSSWIFGRILVGDTAQGYRLNPNLVEAYLEFF